MYFVFRKSIPPKIAFSNVSHPCEYAYSAAFSKIVDVEFPLAVS